MAGPVAVALHLHNTANKGYAKLVAALETVVRQFDTALGGLGGCPFIKGATGNIATAHTVHLLKDMGLHPGIDIQQGHEPARQWTCTPDSHCPACSASCIRTW